MEDGVRGVHLDLAVRPVGLVTGYVTDSAQIPNLPVEESLALAYHQRGRSAMRMPVQVSSLTRRQGTRLHGTLSLR